MLAGAGIDKVLTTNALGVASWQTPAGGSLWTQTGNDIYYNTGNVGIGTMTPGSAKLKIVGGVLNMSTQKITNLATPTADTDAATKAYVDATAFGTCDGTLLKIKFTSALYTGNLGGQSGGNAKCNSEYPGYTLCTTTQIADYALIGCLPLSGQYLPKTLSRIWSGTNNKLDCCGYTDPTTTYYCTICSIGLECNAAALYTSYYYSAYDNYLSWGTYQPSNALDYCRFSRPLGCCKASL